MEFFPLAPYHVAISASTRVLLYDCNTCRVKRQFTRFKDKAYSGTFRGDGRLMCAGGETGIVQLFDTESRSLLRQFKGHTKPVRAVRYTQNYQRIISGGDDAVVRLWDVPTGEQVVDFAQHSDYIRSIASSPVSENLWCTGSYDHTAKLWDSRTGSCQITLDHKAPVEGIQFFPTGSMAITVGGYSIRIWDLLAGGKLVHEISNHQKTVTSVCVAAEAGPASSSSSRILTGSLDSHVRVFEVGTYTMTHMSKFPGAILSLGLSPDNKTMVAGMANGLLSIRRRKKVTDAKDAVGSGGATTKANKYKPRKKLTADTYKYFVRGQSEKAAEGDIKISAQHRKHIAPYDKLLRKFCYGEALDAALETTRPQIVSSVLDELSMRGGLRIALQGRSSETLSPLLHFVCKYIQDPRYTPLMIKMSNLLLDLYSGMIGVSSAVDSLFGILHGKIKEELKYQEHLMSLQGMAEPILYGSIRAVPETIER